MYLVLLHYPVTNRRGEVVTTSVTNMDLHDISRTSRTFGVQKYFVVTPLEEQHEVVSRIIGHWRSPLATDENPDRVEAFSRVELMSDFESVQKKVEEAHGQKPFVVMPDARPLPDVLTYHALRESLNKGEITRPVVIVLGTGWGVAEAFYAHVDRFLAPINGPEPAEGEESYNHLSVRSAAAIVLDRILGV